MKPTPQKTPPPHAIPTPLPPTHPKHVCTSRRTRFSTGASGARTVVGLLRRRFGGGRAGMGRKPCCEKVGLKRGPWTVDEDHKLVSYITNSGIGCWRAIPKLAGLLRCGKSCRLRWTNYLRPDLKRGIFTGEEENTILELHATLGNRWSRIAAQLPGRTDNEIKNYWNTRLKKRLRSQGLDPATHLPLGEGESEDYDGEDSDVASGPPRKQARKRKQAPVRQPRGPKPAPQLTMCQSDDGPVLVKVPKSPPPKGDDEELSSSSTVTAEDSNKLTDLPSYPEAELWKSIKSSLLLDEWADSYRPVDPPLLINPFPTVALKLDTSDMMHFNAQDDIFQQPEMAWGMEMCHSAPEAEFTPSSIRETPPSAPLQQSQELQRLAAILDLI